MTPHDDLGEVRGGAMQDMSRWGRETAREWTEYLEAPEDEGGRDLPDSFVFLALDVFGLLCASVLVVLGYGRSRS
jgi:hypothetical protein